jgi:hypothetical protein
MLLIKKKIVKTKLKMKRRIEGMRTVCLIILSLVAVSAVIKMKKINNTSLYNESALKNFIISTSGISEKIAVNSLDSILNNVSEDSISFCKTASYLEKPFGDPNSVYRNENLYSNLLQAK